MPNCPTPGSPGNTYPSHPFCGLDQAGSFSIRAIVMNVHVERDDREAKFWLDPILLTRSRGFGRRELRQTQTIIQDNLQHILK